MFVLTKEKSGKYFGIYVKLASTRFEGLFQCTHHKIVLLAQKVRGPCPLINLTCPSSKHWICLQDFCIIHHICGRKRKSAVWSHLSLSTRELERDGRKKWKWWKRSWGWGKVREGQRKRLGGRKRDDEKGKDIKWEIKKRARDQMVDAVQGEGSC